MGRYGWREEAYTEEDAKKLRGRPKEWTLFSDGYKEDGTRIYDEVDGVLCHQCRWARQAAGQTHAVLKCTIQGYLLHLRTRGGICAVRGSELWQNELYDSEWFDETCHQCRMVQVRKAEREGGCVADVQVDMKS